MRQDWKNYFAKLLPWTLSHCNNEDQLKRVLYEGLRPDIKHQAAYKNDMITDYNLFKMELRKIEAEKEKQRNAAPQWI